MGICELLRSGLASLVAISTQMIGILPLFKKLENNMEKAKKVEPLEQIIDILVSNARDSHVSRLQNGQCTLEQGFIYSEILTNIERVSDHCSNIAVYQIQVNHPTFDKHNYLNNVKSFKDEDFNKNFNMYKSKYLQNMASN